MSLYLPLPPVPLCPALLSHYVPCPGPKVLLARQVARDDPCTMCMIRSSGVSAGATSRSMISANPIHLRHLPVAEYQTTRILYTSRGLTILGTTRWSRSAFQTMMKGMMIMHPDRHVTTLVAPLSQYPPMPPSLRA